MTPDETVADEIGLDLLSDEELRAAIDRRIATLNRALAAQGKRQGTNSLSYTSYVGPRCRVIYDAGF
jgi:hypothetical protein